MSQCAAEMTLDHIAGDIEPLGNRIRLQTVKTMENEDRPTSNRQFRDGGAEHIQACLDLYRMVGCGGFGGNRQRLLFAA